MTTKHSRVRGRTSAATDAPTTHHLARFASDSVRAEAMLAGRQLAQRVHRASVARWRRTSAALAAVVFAGLGSVSFAGSAATAGVNPPPNSVKAFGPATDLSTGFNVALREGVVGIAATHTGRGYWLTAADGGVFAFGDAAFYGSMGAQHLNAPIVGMATSPTGRGYWLVGADGGVFAYGDAAFEGSTVGVSLAAPIIGIVPTVDGQGYWLVGSDGGIFAFGDARFHGSGLSLELAAPIVGAAASASGHGYWLLGSDGGVFAFGDAAFRGSQPDLSHPAVGIATAGSGYLIAYADGSVKGFGTTVPGNTPTVDVNVEHANTVAIAAGPNGGYWLAQGATDPTSSLANDPFLACTRGHESSGAGGYQAVSAGGTYRGAYQFDRSTWNSAAALAGRADLVGADPAAVAPADQDLVAIALFHSRGTQPWGGRCAGLT